MKHVSKDAPPTDFDAWKAQANEDWTPTYNDLRDPEKRNLHSALLAEQGSVCCYCGRSISLEDSHIEHFRPQEQYAGLQLEYANLHASCMRGLRRSMPRHCGHAKENGFDEEQHIAPADPDCERRFMYTLRGEIVPADSEDERAKYMIGLLALEAPTLRHLREEVLSQTLDPSFLATATQQEGVKLIGLRVPLFRPEALHVVVDHDLAEQRHQHRDPLRRGAYDSVTQRDVLRSPSPEDRR